MESFVPLVNENLRSALWFQPELALTFGTLVLFVIDLFWRKSAARVAYLLEKHSKVRGTFLRCPQCKAEMDPEEVQQADVGAAG